MREPARTLFEAVLVGAIALGAGLVANAVNADGLSLTRDYFRTATPAGSASSGAPAASGTAVTPGGQGGQAGPSAQVAPTAPGVAPTVAPAAPSTAGGPGAQTAPKGAASAPPAGAHDAEAGADAAAEAVAERLRQHGLQVVTHAEARALFEDPAYAAGAYVFVDARGDDAYRAGHVPGAVQFDRYHPERHVADVTAACAGALKVIVYCIGVNCEDSEMAAQDLPALGIDPRAVHVYAGGFTAWSAAGLPVEKGKRGGGDG